MSTIAIIGAGSIGEALIAGLIGAGRDPQSIIATNRTVSRNRYLAQTYGVRTSNDNETVVDGADFLVIAVKPAQVVPLLGELSDTIAHNDSTIVVSLAAGVSVGAMEEALSAGTPVVRVMPNTPMLVGKGVSACAAGRFVTDDQMDSVAELLRTVGEVVRVKESEMDAVCALSGSAPAYYFLMAEALVDAGVSLGLSRELSTTLAKCVASGAGALVEQHDGELSALRAAVSSPAGTTVAAVRELEESGLRGAIYRATEACAKRSAELGS
ncbi:pyrroline-5-carboxylate reductase [Corynebacterium uterequi]|nr:pyrroline-5-carboxylate reductase [Corynebacterium uterequi]